MSSLNYTTYVSQIANLMAASTGDPNFTTMLPGAIDYAEQRAYRDLNLTATITVDATTQVSSGVRDFVLPTDQGVYITVDQVNIITPAGTQSTGSGAVRSPVVPATRDWVDNVYPTAASSYCGVPEYYAVRTGLGASLNPGTITFGPAPDQPYYAEVIGIQRPASLSASNSSTFLTQYCPDLMIAATMVFVSGYMRDFGQQSDNPQMGTAWEQQYQTLMKSAAIEQLRAQFQSEAWTSKQPVGIIGDKRA